MLREREASRLMEKDMDRWFGEFGKSDIIFVLK